ncbi:hypothetical protein F4810DRAFT_708947 [Camillea tinctor]|nr:hypothetical protein F4810DRAFT_708947 [Camillea tinctor]
MKNDDILEAVYESLSQDRSGRWLMVLDGWDDEATLKAIVSSRSKKTLLDYVPNKGRLRVLATTRSKKIAMKIVGGNSQFVIEVSQLKDDDASLLLLGKETPDLSMKRKAAARAKELGGSADYGMVEPSADGTVITVTALIRGCVQKCLDDKGEREMVEEHVLSILCNKLHGDEPLTAEVLLPCALAALKFQPTSVDVKLKLANLHSKVAKLYGNTKEDQLAVNHWERAMSLYEEDPENSHDLVRDAKRALQEARARAESAESHSGELVKSGAMVSRVAKKKEELLAFERSAGAHHPDTVRQANETAAFQLMHGVPSEAQDSVELLRRVLDWCKDKWGENSIDVARRQYNLAIALEHQGEYDRAEQLYRSALRIAGPPREALQATLLGQRKALGADHPDTLKTRHNVAMMLSEEGQLDTAVDELKHVLFVQVQRSGSPEKAESILRETLGIQRRLFGETHSDRAKTKVTLKELLSQVGMMRM